MDNINPYKKGYHYTRYDSRTIEVLPIVIYHHFSEYSSHVPHNTHRWSDKSR